MDLLGHNMYVYSYYIRIYIHTKINAFIFVRVHTLVLLFILGSNLGGVGPVRGLLGGGRRGWCDEWARSG